MVGDKGVVMEEEDGIVFVQGLIGANVKLHENDIRVCVVMVVLLGQGWLRWSLQGQFGQ